MADLGVVVLPYATVEEYGISWGVCFAASSDLPLLQVVFFLGVGEVDFSHAVVRGCWVGAGHFRSVAFIQPSSLSKYPTLALS